MAMMPKRVKHRKEQRGRLKGSATRGNTVTFGEFGLQSLDQGWISGRQIDHRELMLGLYMLPDRVLLALKKDHAPFLQVGQRHQHIVRRMHF